jgi:hypothetical protein
MRSTLSGRRYVGFIFIIDSIELTVWQYFQGFRRGSPDTNGTHQANGTAGANGAVAPEIDRDVGDEN